MNQHSAFTLIELMIVMAITAVLTVASLGYNRANEKRLALIRDRAVIIGLLNRAKSLTAQKFNQNLNACAFGVSFQNNSADFILFQDLKNNDGEFGCKNADGTYKSSLRYDDANGNEELEKQSLDSRLRLSVTGGNTDILFISPELNVTSTASFPIILDLIAKDGSEKTTIQVEAGGQIIMK